MRKRIITVRKRPIFPRLSVGADSYTLAHSLAAALGTLPRPVGQPATDQATSLRKRRLLCVNSECSGLRAARRGALCDVPDVTSGDHVTSGRRGWLEAGSHAVLFKYILIFRVFNVRLRAVLVSAYWCGSAATMCMVACICLRKFT
jgi:hypothetical protein